MKLIGIIKGVSKKNGKPYTILSATSDYSMREYGNGAIGIKSETVWAWEEVSNKVTNDWVNGDIRVYYDRNGNVEDIELLGTKAK